MYEGAAAASQGGAALWWCRWLVRQRRQWCLPGPRVSPAPVFPPQPCPADTPAAARRRGSIIRPRLCPTCRPRWLCQRVSFTHPAAQQQLPQQQQLGHQSQVQALQQQQSLQQTSQLTWGRAAYGAVAAPCQRHWRRWCHWGSGGSQSATPGPDNLLCPTPVGQYQPPGIRSAGNKPSCGRTRRPLLLWMPTTSGGSSPTTI